MDFMLINQEKARVVKAKNLERQITQSWADLGCTEQKYGDYFWKDGM